MQIKETFSYIVDNSKQAIQETFQNAKNNVDFAINRFKAAPGKEKAWVLFKTFCVAIACGIVAALVGLNIIPTLAAIIAGGAYALYRFSRTARNPEEVQVKQMLDGVAQQLQNNLNLNR